VVGYLVFERDWFEREIGIPPVSAAIVEVRGKSMEPDLNDGDLAVVDMRSTSFVDDAIYVVRQGSALRLKKVRLRLDGKIEIRSSNEASYAPEIVSAAEAEQLVIIGRAGTVVPKVRRLS
jgi:phage repressor protein C with HTH and peptisase S24 domain